jgi:hypothetical protein
MMGLRVGIPSAVLSVMMGLAAQHHWLSLDSPWIGTTVIGIWVLVPPIYLWFDWYLFFEHADDASMTNAVKAARRDIAKHSHDLARNIWLGLILILFALFTGKFPGS